MILEDMEERDQDYEEMSNEPNFSKLLDINGNFRNNLYRIN